MTDPLSAAGLAVGVASLGIQVSGGITTYINSLNCRDKDIASIRQQNASLQKSLEVIQGSHSQFHRKHHPATTAVHECLDSCKNELSALESLISDLTSCDQLATTRTDKFKSQGKKLLYPFSRPKVKELETRICNANSALQLALQTLGLSVSQFGTEKLATIETSCYSISTSVLATQSKVSALDIPLQDIHSTVSGLETRFDTLEALIAQAFSPQPTSDGISQQIPPAVATGRLLGKPGFLRDVCNAASARARPGPNETLLPRHLGATQRGKGVLTYARGRFSCLCSNRRSLRRKNVAWGSLTLSFEDATEQHLPGCPAAQATMAPDRCQTVILTYTGLRNLLNQAIRASFTMRWGAGAGSISPNVTYYPIVDSQTAPAFRILSLIERSYPIERSYLIERSYPIGILTGGLSDVLWTDNFVPSATSAIMRLFEAKKASFRAVDADNRSLVHYLAKVIGRASSSTERVLPSHSRSSALLDLLEYLLVNKAPANSHDSSGNTPVVDVFPYYKYNGITDPLSVAATELILSSNTEGNMASLSKPPFPLIGSTILDGSEQLVQAGRIALMLYDFAFSPRIAEAYGCGPLSMAVLSENLEQVEYLVKNHPATLTEQNLCGHSPLHLAANKPSCLRLLVKAADATVLNHVDRTEKYISGTSALETAVSLSGMRCQAPKHGAMCRRCTCAECAVILLEAGCALPVSFRLQHILSLASKRCKMRFVRHLRNRRDRLKQLALDNLPATQLEQLDLDPEHVLDFLAPRVVESLEERGIYISDALAVTRDGPSSIYQEIRTPADAELFYRAGFHDTEVWCQDYATDLTYASFLEEELPFLHWMDTHGASFCQLKSVTAPRDIFKANLIFLRVGEDLRSTYEFPGSGGQWLSESSHSQLGEWALSPPLDGRRAWIQKIQSTALSANIADSCRCKCSPGGCTPLVSLLKGALQSDDLASELGCFAETDHWETESTEAAFRLPSTIITFTQYLKSFGSNIEVRHHAAALRYLTFTALGIHHVCCDPYDNTWEESSENEEEFEDKYFYELELLEELLAEFEGEVDAILQDPSREIVDPITFWERTWVNRMGEVLRSLRGSDLEDDVRRRAEEIGVVWDTPHPQPQVPEVPENPYDKNTLDYWMNELEKIEAEFK